MADSPTMPDNPTTRDHTRCCFSTNIAGRITAGRGRLAWDGEWEFRCDECADRVNKKWEKEINHA